MHNSASGPFLGHSTLADGQFSGRTQPACLRQRDHHNSATTYLEQDAECAGGHGLAEPIAVLQRGDGGPVAFNELCPQLRPKSVPLGAHQAWRAVLVLFAVGVGVADVLSRGE